MKVAFQQTRVVWERLKLVSQSRFRSLRYTSSATAERFAGYIHGRRRGGLMF
jgi:hypothetical protein